MARLTTRADAKPPVREILHDSAFARLQAKMESMPVIE
jgi:hypothetical protein